MRSNKSLKPKVKKAAIGVALMLAAGSGWFLFRTTTIDHPPGRAHYRRTFGRVTSLEADTNGDNQIDYKRVYSWREPYPGIVEGPDCYETGSLIADRNFDGQWDTWGAYLEDQPGGRCVMSFEADTTLDGVPDLGFVATDAEGYDRLRNLRGF